MATAQSPLPRATFLGNVSLVSDPLSSLKEGQEMPPGTASWSFEVSEFAEIGRRGLPPPPNSRPQLEVSGLSLWAGPPPWGLVLSAAKTRPQPPVRSAASGPELWLCQALC